MRIKTLLLIILACTFYVLPAQTYYGNIIYINPKQYRSVKPAVDDLKSYLTLAIGKDFVLDTKDTTATGGIKVVLLSKQQADNNMRLDKNNDDMALLKSDGKSGLVISAYTKQGLANGIYTYLDTLGFRWYHPGDEWTHVPKLNDIRLKLDKVFIPDMQVRTFFGTYGTPRNVVVDPKKEIEAKWNLWAIRNRMGGNYTLKGHAWNDFLWRNRTELTAHPEYMALVKDKRAAVNTASKFCISNQAFQQLFVNDMVAQLQKAMAANPNAAVYTISVEPSDGGGDCQCSECAKMGSVSNRVFYLANLVAAEFKKIAPNAYVNLYAYNTHAAPPNFKLQDNVLVQLIPYKYQKYAEPKAMIEAWNGKADNLFIYDYYGLPLTNVDMPLRTWQTPDALANKMKYWYTQNIQGVTLESSYSIGATGLGLYMFVRLACNKNTDINKLKDEYYANCYGAAAKAVQLAQHALTEDTVSNELALANATVVLNKQLNKVKLTANEQVCVTDYKAYLHYLNLLYAYKHGNGKNTPAACDSLMQFVYGTFYRMMVHNYPLSEYLKNTGKSKGYITANWDSMKPTAPGMKFNTIYQWSDQEINDAF
jgi:hypothetical protein